MKPQQMLQRLPGRAMKQMIFRVVSLGKRSQNFDPLIDQLDISFSRGGEITLEEAGPLAEATSSKGAQS